MNKICSVISFCTYDVRFLHKCISSVIPFSEQILIPVCDHFYNGQEENYSLLEKIYQSYPEIQFLEFAYSEEEIYGSPMKFFPGSPGYAQHWHNTARLVSFYFLKEHIDGVLFCDVDEIIDNFPNKAFIQDFSAVRFATYWYFLKASYRATTTPDGPLLVKRDTLYPQLLINPDERSGIFETFAGKKVKGFCVNGLPLVHHYSWVRTKEELLQKTRSWGHHWERNWENLLLKIFDTPFSGSDFVRGYTYETVAPFWDPLQESIPVVTNEISLHQHNLNLKRIKNVKKITAQEVFRLEINWEIQSESSVIYNK